MTLPIIVGCCGWPEARAKYFRLHGRGGYRYRYSDDELEALRRMCLRQVEEGRRPVYCLFNNVFMLEDALRFQRLGGTGSRGLGCSITDLQRPPGVVCHLE